MYNLRNEGYFIKLEFDFVFFLFKNALAITHVGKYL